MKMKRSKIAMLVLSAMALIAVTGCPNPTTVDPKTEDPIEKTLAQQVVDELGEALAVQTVSPSVRAVAATDITAIKAAALKKITDDGHANSQKLDIILPLMIAGAAEGSKTLSSEVKSSIYTASAKSALESLGKPERSTKLSSGKTLTQTVGFVSEATVTAVVTNLTGTDASNSLKAVSKATVKVVCENKEYAKVSDDAVSASVTGSLKALETKSSSATEGSADDKDKKLTDDFKDILDASLKQAAVTKKASMSDVISSVNTEVVKASKEKTYAATITSDTITASVKIAVSVSGTDGDAAAELIKAAVGGQKNGGVSVAASVVTEAITEAITENPENATNLGDAFATEMEQAINYINTETVPTVTISASPAKLVAAGEVTLTATIEDADTKTVSWKQTAGSTVSITTATAAVATVNIQTPGVYTFQVTVTNKDGYLSASKTVTVTFEKASANVSNLIAEGITALESKKFDTALTKFEAAYSADKTNSEATFWYAFMSMMSISTDTSTVSLMRDRIGATSYPDSMETVFSNKWFNKEYYNTEWGMVPASEDDNYWYVRGTATFITYPVADENDQIAQDELNAYYNAPFLSVRTADDGWQYGRGTFEPKALGEVYGENFTKEGTTYSPWSNPYPLESGFCYTQGSLLDKTNPIMLPALEVPTWAESVYSLAGVFGDSATTTSTSSYSNILMMNLISRNPDGLNSMLDLVLSGVYGTRFNRVVQLIDSLPDTASITVPQSLIDAYNPYGGGNSASGEMPVITIRKAELKALSASLQMTKSLFQLLASYNLDYSIAFLQKELWTSGGGKASLVDLYAQKNPLSSGFLGNRSDATRSASRETFLAAIDDLTDALNLFALDIEDTETLASQALEQMNLGEVEEIKSYIDEVSTLVATLRNSITGGGSLFINPAAMNGGSLSALLSTTTVEDALECKPAALWSTDIFSPAHLFEVNGTEEKPTGLKLYGLTDKGWDVLVKPDDITTAPAYLGLGLKVKTTRVNTLITVPEIAFVGSTKDILRIAGGSPTQFSEDDWKLIDWLSK